MDGNIDQPMKSNGKLWGIIGTIAALAIAGGIFVGTRPGSQTVVTNPVTTPTPVVTPPVTTTPPPVTKPKPVTSAYKDGTYSAVGDYHSPDGAESINVTLTLKNDIVTSATVTSNVAAPTSRNYQSMFISGYQAQVIGKDISTLNLTKVSGSSLTPRGFDNALAQIKSEAKA